MLGMHMSACFLSAIQILWYFSAYFYASSNALIVAFNLLIGFHFFMSLKYDLPKSFL